MQAAVDNRAVLGQDFAPIREKLRVVMLPGLMRLQARPKIDVHAIRILPLARAAADAESALPQTKQTAINRQSDSS